MELESTIAKLYDYNTELTPETRGEMAEQLKAIKYALLDAKVFAEYIEILGRTDCEIYKHELHGSASLELKRLDKVLY